MSWSIAIYDLDFVDKTLKRVILDKESAFGEGVITSLYRINDPGPHGTLPLRAMDERCKDSIIGNRVAEYLNSRWVYDFNRPDMKVCIFHDVGKGVHLHYQVHPNTRRL